MVEIDGYRFAFNKDFSGEISIQAPMGQTEQHTMDGRVGLAVPAETILKFVADQFVKPILMARISNLDPVSVLIGSV